jgi:hypothetical protein
MSVGMNLDEAISLLWKKHPPDGHCARNPEICPAMLWQPLCARRY